jgi:hypothetical protein
VRKALEELDRLGDDPVRAHLVSVDPYQKGSYRDLVTVSGGVRDPRSSMTYRSIQALALQQHVSQADASVIGLKRLPPLPYEYYDAVRWSESSTLEDWLQPNAVGAR